jgi:putative flippase GtrA
VELKQAVSSKENIVQFIKFSIIGLSNLGISLCVYYFLLWLGIHYIIANVAGWVVSVFNAFFWNKRFVFQTGSSWVKALIKTYISYGFSFLLGTLLLYILVEWCGIPKVVAPLIVVIATTPINFLMNKFWTFK